MTRGSRQVHTFRRASGSIERSTNMSGHMNRHPDATEEAMMTNIRFAELHRTLAPARRAFSTAAFLMCALVSVAGAPQSFKTPPEARGRARAAGEDTDHQGHGAHSRPGR